MSNRTVFHMIKSRVFVVKTKQTVVAVTCLLVFGMSACSSDSDSGNANAGSGSDGGSIEFDLPALPNPPLTEAPSADDEPIPENTEFNVLSNFQLVRDPGPRLPVDIPVDLTDEDFEAGPLPAVISVPDDVDPSVNSAPYFENLQDQTVVAGEILEVLYKPVDADGDLPGMFPEELPQGASFEDNFNGTKTFRWQPLQMDAGIREFTVTAVDAVSALYRTTRTIRIKVVLPEDLSTIPNVAPMLDEFLPHAAILNEPVILELKGIDLNGSIPTLELVSDINGASFLQHPRYEEVFTLKFTPRETGTQTIDILARDSVDTSLTRTESISVDVFSPAELATTGLPLKDLAAQHGRKFGYASLQNFYHRPDGSAYAFVAAREFNLVTPENSMKMDNTNPEEGRYQFADTDNLISFAKQNNMQVHGHPLVWHRQLPDWILNKPDSEIVLHMREYIHRIMTRYKDDIDVWDVVNEPVGDKGGYRESVWYDAIGESYIDIAFKQARTTAPEATLLLNEFDIAFNGPKADSLFEILDDLLAKNTPIDGVGFQMHFFASFDQFDDVVENFQKVADRGLDIYINELDVSLGPDNDEQLQAEVYAKIIDICLAQPRCKSIQTWGFTDQYSFRRFFEPLLFDVNYMAKPAYYAIQNALQNP